VDEISDRKRSSGMSGFFFCFMFGLICGRLKCWESVRSKLHVTAETFGKHFLLTVLPDIQWKMVKHFDIKSTRLKKLQFLPIVFS